MVFKLVLFLDFSALNEILGQYLVGQSPRNRAAVGLRRCQQQPHLHGHPHVSTLHAQAVARGRCWGRGALSIHTDSGSHFTVEETKSSNWPHSRKRPEVTEWLVAELEPELSHANTLATGARLPQTNPLTLSVGPIWGREVTTKSCCHRFPPGKDSLPPHLSFSRF